VTSRISKIVWLALRSAGVAKPGRFKVRGAALPHAVAPSSATLVSGNEQHPRSNEYDDPWTAWRHRSAGPGLDAMAGVFFSTEGEISFGLFEGCELGALLGLMRIGRSAVCTLNEAFGVAIRVALRRRRSANQPESARCEVLPRRARAACGIDISKRLGSVLVLLNANVGYAPHYREIRGDLPVHAHDERGDGQGDINVVRNELRLSVPIGVALPLGSQPARADADRGYTIVRPPRRFDPRPIRLGVDRYNVTPARERSR